MAAAEVVVLTSDYEGYPAVAVEALAAGAYVVSSNCSVGMRDILLTDELGAIVTVQRPAEFAAALRRFFDRTDRDGAARRAALARPLVEAHVALEAARRHLTFMGLEKRLPRSGD
jgi:glycosyltransferase involved in cell wall biosynthesis